MSAEEVIEYTDADTGQPFRFETLIDRARVGEVVTKRIGVKNIGIHPIRCENPRTEGLNILTYPNNPEMPERPNVSRDDPDYQTKMAEWMASVDVIRPGETRQMEIEFDVPKDAVIPPTGAWQFDVAVIAFG
jgi:hypothetical protein